MLDRQRRPYSNCPICQEEDEHLVHVLTCPHHDSLTLRTTLVDALKAWLIKEHTHPDVTAFLLQGLTSWFNDPYGDEIRLNCADPTSQSTLLEQLDLGGICAIKPDFVSVGVSKPGCEALQQEGSDIRMRMLLDQPCFKCVDEGST